MKWTKLGRIIEINNFNDWLVSHSAVPFAIHQHGDIFKVFFSVRNKLNQSQSAYVDFDVVKMEIVNRLTQKPFLSPGEKGQFDDAGVTLSCYCNDNNMFYYMGWNLSTNAPFDNQIGAAMLSGITLAKHKSNPILGKCEKEPLSFGYPWVLKANKQYYMWYDTNFFWDSNDPKNYKFQLRSAISKDGLNWEKTYQNNLKLLDNERAIARPCVIFEDDIFKMWYSVDVDGVYSLGYAESKDGLDWKRMDEHIGLKKSSEGWDSEEVEYPFVFDHNGNRYMLYNGNKYGKTGIGLAILEK